MCLLGINSEVSRSVREFGLERADMLRRNSVSAPMGSTQPSVGAGVGGLLKNFLNPRLSWRQNSFCRVIFCLSWKRLVLLQRRKLISDIPSLRDQFYRVRGGGFAQNGI